MHDSNYCFSTLSVIGSLLRKHRHNFDCAWIHRSAAQGLRLADEGGVVVTRPTG
jgi:hypothetical protein